MPTPRKTQQQFEEDMIAIHGNRFDFHLASYSTRKSKIWVICKIHGPFQITPTVLYRGGGCQRCAFEKMVIREQQNKRVLNFKEKIEAYYPHLFFPNADKEYVNMDSFITGVCLEHGEFKTQAKYLTRIKRPCYQCYNEHRIKNLSSIHDRKTR